MAGLVPFNQNRSILRRRGFEDFYNMLDDFFNDTWLPGRSLLSDSFKIDVKETEKAYTVEAELPGVKKEEIKLELNDGRLSITVQREERTEEENKNYVHRERRFGSMQRSVYLADVKPEGVTAKFRDGLLEVTVPKAEHPDKSRKIEIQ